MASIKQSLFITPKDPDALSVTYPAPSQTLATLSLTTTVIAQKLWEYPCVHIVAQCHHIVPCLMLHAVVT